MNNTDDSTRVFSLRDVAPDFRVRYRFLSSEEGGRRVLPANGYRPDWLYDGDDPLVDGIWAIYPEFEDRDGVALPKGERALAEGYACMLILNPELRRQVHLARVRVGARGYMVEGPKPVAEAEIVEILGIEKNAERL